jgi:predicted Zn-dependent protease
MPLTVKRGDSVSTVLIPMDTVCNYGVVVQKDDALNAFADGNTIYVTSAMMRFATEPAEIETVVAHEIAHNAMGHIDAKKRNAAVAGLFGVLLDVAAASQGVNTGGEYTKQMAALGAMTFSQDFEREADYVGLYIMARANEPVTSSANLWRRMATESPGSIKFASSHPTTVERYVRLEAAAAEIEQKRTTGEPLVPELKTKSK